jgi:hypothetical protein
MGSTTVPEFIYPWADEVTRTEGWVPAGASLNFPHGSMSWRNHNPGNIVHHGQYATFTTYEEGRAALCADLFAKVQEHPSDTVLQVMEIYCPPPDGNPLNRGNNPQAYAERVAKALGVSVDTQMCNLGMLRDQNHRQYVPAVFPH